MTKDKIVEQLEKLGYMYSTKLWNDGTVMAYRFRCSDYSHEGCYWEVAVEDHTEDDGKDWLIFVRYHDPDQKAWEGYHIDTSGCVEFEVMKLIVEFTEILKKENK